MGFKRALQFTVLFGMLWYSQTSAHTVGLIVRPSMIKNLEPWIREELKDLSVDFCSLGYGFRLHTEASLSETEWHPTTQGGLRIRALISPVKDKESVLVKGEVLTNCTGNGQVTGAIQITMPSFPIDLYLHLQNLNVELGTEPMKKALKDFQLLDIKVSEHLAKLQEDLQKNATKVELANAMLGQISRVSSEWMASSLRNLYHEESLKSLLSGSLIATEGLIHEQGALRLLVRNQSQPDLKTRFVFFSPARQNFAFSDVSSLSVFLNAGFLTSQSGLPEPPANGLRPSLARVQAVQQRLDANLQLPEKDLGEESDLTLVGSIDLINEAFQSVYSENIKQLEMNVNLGKASKNLIASKDLDVETLITLNPKRAPQIQLAGQTLILRVSDFSVNVGTFLEDRVIPSTQFEVSVETPTSFAVNKERQQVMAVLDPKKFVVHLKDLQSRVLPRDVKFFEELATVAWRDFIATNPRLELFSSLVNFQNIPLEVSGVTPSENHVFIHFKIKERPQL